MKDIIRRLIHRYGMQIQVISPQGEQTVRIFLQPVTSKSWQNMERMIPPGGEILRGQHLFIGESGCGVATGDVLQVDGRRFFVRRVDSIRYRGQTLYIWGLCVEGGGADPWST